jgi:small subunit ribosomal protein S35
MGFLTDDQDPKSPLSASTPLDTRHLLARQAKRRSKSSGGAWRKTEALSKRQEIIGGVRGFPAEWVLQSEPAGSEATKA